MFRQPLHAAPLQIIESVVEALWRQRALEATLAAAPAQLAAALLQHCRSQLGRPLYARTAIAMAERLLSSCPATLDAGGVGLEHLERLEGAVAEELRTQEQLMGVQGMVSALVG